MKPSLSSAVRWLFLIAVFVYAFCEEIVRRAFHFAVLVAGFANFVVRACFLHIPSAAFHFAVHVFGLWMFKQLVQFCQKDLRRERKRLLKSAKRVMRKKILKEGMREVKRLSFKERF